VHLLVVFAPAQDDAADVVSATPACRGHDLLAVRATVETFNLPDVWLDLRVLKLLDGLHHQPGRRSRSYIFLSPLSRSSCAGSAGTSNSNMKRLLEFPILILRWKRLLEFPILILRWKRPFEFPIPEYRMKWYCDDSQ
jgi:hypothetical protein